MWFLWIAIIFLVVMGIIGTFLHYNRRSLFNKHKSIFEFWGIIIPILLALLAFLQTQLAMESSTKDFGNIVGRMDDIISKAEESSKSLHNVDVSISKLPQQMDSLSKSIIAFNDVISSQKEQLTITINGLNSSILDFKSTVDAMTERFNRKPELNVDLHTYLTDTSRVIYKIVITNRGNLLADIYRMTYKIDSNYVISVTNARKIDNAERNATYQEEFLTPIPLFPPAPAYNTTSATKFDCNMILTTDDNYFLRINVYYKANFGNDGIATAIFIFNKNKEQPEKLIIKTD